LKIRSPPAARAQGFVRVVQGWHQPSFGEGTATENAAGNPATFGFVRLVILPRLQPM
jgi:hypothetical protein